MNAVEFKMKSSFATSVLAGVSLLAFSAPAFAQGQQAAASTAQGAPAGGLEEIVVTAQKRAENLQSVPISVAAVSGAALERQKITNIAGLANSIPNVQINQWANSPDSAVFTIRGVGVNDPDPYVGTTVSVVVDGVVVGVNTAALSNLFDIERVEILRGPQGTLFGANTTGGVINVVTKQPTGEFGGEAQVSYGNYNRLEVNAAMNFPITDKLAGKISVLHTGRDGYFSDVLTGANLGKVDMTNLRAYLKFDGGGAYDATLIGEYGRTRNDSQTNLNLSDPSLVIYDPVYSSPTNKGYERGQSTDQPNYNNRDSYSLTLTQNIGSAIGDIVAISNYRKYDQDLYSDDDAVPAVLLQSRRQIKHEQYSQELRDTVNVNDAVQLIFGGFAFHQKYSLIQGTKLDGFVLGLGQPQTQRQESTSLSAFSQVYLQLTSQLRLQAGVRYSREKTSATSTTANTFAPVAGELSSFNDPVIPGSFISASGKKLWGKAGWKVGLDFKPTDSTMLYGYYARGFKSGGFTGRIAVAEDIGPFNPETLDTFEIGVKSDLLDRRLRINLAAFYNLYKDMQVTQNITYASGANSATIVNAGKAKTKGVELELTAVPVESLTLSGSLAYLDARYTKYDTRILGPSGLVAVSYAGNRLMNAPEWSGAASLNYVTAVAGGKAALFIQDTFASSKFTNFTGLPQERVDAINLVNANISWTPEDETWSVSLYGRNLFDTKYYGQKSYFAPAYATAGMGTPREYGVTFKVSW